MPSRECQAATHGLQELWVSVLPWMWQGNQHPRDHLIAIRQRVAFDFQGSFFYIYIYKKNRRISFLTRFFLSGFLTTLLASRSWNWTCLLQYPCAIPCIYKHFYRASLHSYLTNTFSLYNISGFYTHLEMAVRLKNWRVLPSRNVQHPRDLCPVRRYAG
jgi:hypothetical protein